jgi:hypothetical protein
LFAAATSGCRPPTWVRRSRHGRANDGKAGGADHLSPGFGNKVHEKNSGLSIDNLKPFSPSGQYYFYILILVGDF